ncbi:MAG: transketolase [Propionibacteriaceae bacterium]|jgi:transketolase|nr:transketolase [Propionibacteriaceae bacterium]
MASVRRGEGEAERLLELARQVRISIIDAIYHAQVGHLGGPLSMADFMTALYFNVLDIRPSEPDWPDRDRIVLSKGHSSIGLYAVMAHRGYLPLEELRTFDSIHTRLQGHPEMTRLPGIDMSTGSLGQGISAAMGMALGAKLLDKSFHAFAIVGDGECQEGQVWECAMAAARYPLSNFIVIVDHNKLQQFGWLKEIGPDGTRFPFPPEDDGELVRKWTAFGWRVLEMDGHDMADILRVLDEALTPGDDQRPVCIVAHTVKGKGVSYMEGDYRWHAQVLTAELAAQAFADLGEPGLAAATLERSDK